MKKGEEDIQIEQPVEAATVGGKAESLPAAFNPLKQVGVPRL